MASTDISNLKKKPINRNNNKKHCTNIQERLPFNDEQHLIARNWNTSDKTQTAVGRSNTKRSSCQFSSSMNSRQSKCDDSQVVESFRNIQSNNSRSSSSRFSSSSSESSLESLNDAAVSESVTASSHALDRLDRCTVCPRLQWRSTIQRNKKKKTKQPPRHVKHRHKETSSAGACRQHRSTANSLFDRHSFPTDHSLRSGLHHPECRRHHHHHHHHHHTRQFPNHRRRMSRHGSDASIDTLFGLEDGTSNFTPYFDQSAADLSRMSELTSYDRGLCRSKFIPNFDPSGFCSSNTEDTMHHCHGCGSKNRGNNYGFSDRLGCLASFDEKLTENESFCRDAADATFCRSSDLIHRRTPCGNRCRLLRANDYKIESSLLFDSSIDATSAAYPRGTTAHSSNNTGGCTAERYTFSGDVGSSSSYVSSGPKNFDFDADVASILKGDSKRQRPQSARLVSEELSKSRPDESRDFEFENNSGSYDCCSGRYPVNLRSCRDVLTGLRRRRDETDHEEELSEYADEKVLGCKSRNRTKPSSAICGANKGSIRRSSDETDCLHGRSIAMENASSGNSLSGKTPPDFTNESSADDGNKHRSTADSSEKFSDNNLATLESSSSPSSAKTGLERESPTTPPAVGTNRKGRLKKRYRLFTSESRSTETNNGHLKTSNVGDTIREVDEIYGTDYQELLNSKTAAAAAAAAEVNLRDDASENKIEDVGQLRKDASRTSISQTSLSSSHVRDFFTADDAVAASANRRAQEVFFAKSRKIAKPNGISLLPSSKDISSRCSVTFYSFEELLFLPYSLTLVTEDPSSSSSSSEQRLILAPTKLRLVAGFHHHRHQSPCPGDEEVEEEEAIANHERSQSAELESKQTSNQGANIGSRLAPETDNERRTEQTGELQHMYATISSSSSSYSPSDGMQMQKMTRTGEVGNAALSQFTQGKLENVRITSQLINQETGTVEGERVLLDYIWTSVVSQMNPGDKKSDRSYVKVQEQDLGNRNLTVELQSTISPSRLRIALPMLETTCESPTNKQLLLQQQQQQTCLEIQPDAKQQQFNVSERSVVLSAQRRTDDAGAVVFRPRNARLRPGLICPPHYKTGEQCFDASGSQIRDELTRSHRTKTNSNGNKAISNAFGLNNMDVEMSTFKHDATTTELSNAKMDPNETRSSQPSLEDANQALRVTTSVAKTRRPSSSMAQVEGKRPPEQQTSAKQSNSKAVKEITSVSSVRAKTVQNAAAASTTTATSPSSPSKQRSTPRKRPALKPQHSIRSRSQVTGKKDHAPATPPQPDSPKPENRHRFSTTPTPTTTSTKHAKSTTSLPPNRDTSTGRPRSSSMQRGVETCTSASRILALSGRRDHPMAETSIVRRRPVAIQTTPAAPAPARRQPRHNKSTQVAGNTVADKTQMTEQTPISDKSTQISRQSPTVDGTSQTDQQHAKQADKSIQAVRVIEQELLVDQCLQTVQTTPDARPVTYKSATVSSSAALCDSIVSTTNSPIELDEIFFIDESGLVVVGGGGGPKGDLSKLHDSDDRDGGDGEEKLYSFSECKRLIANLERSVREKVKQLTSNRTQHDDSWTKEKLNDDDDDDDDDDRKKLHKPLVVDPTLPESLRKAEARVLLDATAVLGSGALELSEKKTTDERLAQPPEWEQRSTSSAMGLPLVSVSTRNGEFTSIVQNNGRVSFNEEVEVQFIDDSDDDDDDDDDDTSFSDDDVTEESDYSR